MDIFKKILKWILILGLIFILVIAGYFAYHDIMASAAKEYLSEKYDFDSFDVIAYKSTTYVYEDTANCSSLWFKKCTSDTTLKAKYYFINKDKEKIIVTEDIDGKYTDDYYLGEVKDENNSSTIPVN